MSKRPSLKRQVYLALTGQIRYGESKYLAKQEVGVKFGQPVEGIFSKKTFSTYLRESIKFVEWAKREHGCRYLEEAKKYVPEYLERGKATGKSAWTLKTERAALRKLYQDPVLAKEVQLPMRRQEDIKRGRGPALRDRHFSEAKNHDLVDFARATGLRREGLSLVRAKDVIEKGGRLYIAVREKGGRYREAAVLEKYQERVREILQKRARNEEDKLFGHVHSAADIHSYRREYARERYRELTGGRDIREDKANRKLDRKALRQISEDLGHSREEVIMRFYI